MAVGGRDHRLRRNIRQVMAHDVRELSEPEKRHLGQHAPFLRDRVGKDHVERGEAIGLDHEELVLAHGVEVAHLAAVQELQALEGVRFLDDPDQMVVSVAVPISEAKLEALLTTGVAAEPGKEPEVMVKGKEAAAAKEGAAPAAGEKAGAAAAPAAGAEKKEAPKAEKKEAKK